MNLHQVCGATWFLSIAAVPIGDASATPSPTAFDEEARPTAERRDIEAARGGHLARHAGQRWTTHFDGRGFTVIPDSRKFEFGLELESYGGLDASHDVEGPASVTTEGVRLAYRWDDHLTEWYVNGLNGLEHGFTVHARSTSSCTPLVLRLSIRGDLIPVVAASGRDVRFVATDGTALDYAGLAAFDATGRPLAARFEAAAGKLVLSVDDRDAVYPLTIDPVVQHAYLKASNTDVGDEFGWSVAISGDTAVIGAHYESSKATGVDGDSSDDSAPAAGAAYVFVRAGAGWVQQAYLKASNTGAGDEFGWSVAISGDTIVVGAYREDSGATGVDGNQSDESMPDSGAAYVFVRSGAIWSQQAYLKASNLVLGFGYSVAISGDQIVIGVEGEHSDATGVDGDQHNFRAIYSGAAYAFARSASTWSQTAYLKASNTGSFDYFGKSVAIDGDTIIVGALGEDSASVGVDGNSSDENSNRSGAAYTYVREGAGWKYRAYFKASNTGDGDAFGYSVAISGNTIVVSAVFESSSSTGVDGDQHNDDSLWAGAAYVFVYDGTAWTQQAYLKPSSTSPNDGFGDSVSVSGDAIVVGAADEDSSSRGVDGDDDDESAIAAGAAYVFLRNGTTWSHHAYLKASNADGVPGPGHIGDIFGWSVAASGDMVVVGAPGEASNATGVDGDQWDNSHAKSGAAYLFDLDCVAGSFAVYGSGSPGTDGFVPAASLSGTPSLGEDVVLSVRDALGGAVALLITGAARDSIPFAGGELLVAAPWSAWMLALAGAPGIGGAGTLDLVCTLPDDPALEGIVVDAQLLIADPAATRRLALSNGVELVIGC